MLSIILIQNRLKEDLENNMKKRIIKICIWLLWKLKATVIINAKIESCSDVIVSQEEANQFKINKADITPIHDVYNEIRGCHLLGKSLGECYER